MKLQLFAFILLGMLFSNTAADFTSSAYQNQSRSAKLSQLWSSITQNTTPGTYPSSLDLGKLFLESMKPTIDYVSDELPNGRQKLIHSVGSVFSAAFTPVSNTPYTGFFEGADSLLIRISLAASPNYSNPSAKTAYNNFTPGHGLKYLIDGKPSANLVAMHSVNGVNSYNLFDQPYETHIPDASGLALSLVANKFSSATEVIQAVGLKSLAQTRQDGSSVQSPNFPWKLIFQARPEVKALFTEDYTVDFKTVLSQIPVGTVIYDVYAVANPIQNCQELVGTISTTSQPTTSQFGDKNLFFQHQDFQIDLKQHPEWSDYTPFWKGFWNHGSKKAEGSCPFARL